MELAGLYGLVLNVNRDSDDTLVTSACRRLARKVHPDKGGSTQHAQRLLNAKDVWEQARKAARSRGRRATARATGDSQFQCEVGF